ncbi:MAG: 16S rRNA (guanine(966)-N(2))-methyltransferase RsmD [Candidatus Saccharibacteria bacterium]|nr:16S rRNA (guanine(966)-N(2))-methyltransferase RsmD [Candidatus Saccharibacteria bacterium]
MDKITITGGKYRGRKIATPGGATHPMGSRERLALFNMLVGELEGASVLDAFAGSGSLGIEALSRGASEVVFVEKNRVATEVIKQNLAELGASDNTRVIKSSVKDAISDLGEFAVVLADPPYDNFDVTEVEPLAQVVKNDGVLALSHPGDAPEIKGLTLAKTRKYAGASISVYFR